MPTGCSDFTGGINCQRLEGIGAADRSLGSLYLTQMVTKMALTFPEPTPLEDKDKMTVKSN